MVRVSRIATLFCALPLTTAEDAVYLTVAYCPSFFTGGGAVVSVDHQGKYSIVGKWDMPDEILGCPMNEDSNYHSAVAARTTHLSFGTEWGELWAVDLDGGALERRVKANTTDEYLFYGFTNFATTADGKLHRGLTPHVTEYGFCSKGCFRYGHQDVETGLFTGFQSDVGLPFKAVMSDTKFHHEEAGIYYAQGSYPLRSDARCSDDDTAQCLFAINATSGDLLSSKATKDWVAYKYEDALGGVSEDGTVLAWVFGFQDVCGKDLNSYAFARVHLQSASAELISCISKDDVVHMNPNMGGFTHDNKLFATASGNPYAGSMQLLVFDVQSGKTVLNTDLKGLPEALGVKMDEAPFVDVWGLAHMPPAALTLSV